MPNYDECSHEVWLEQYIFTLVGHRTVFVRMTAETHHTVLATTTMQIMQSVRIQMEETQKVEGGAMKQ